MIIANIMQRYDIRVIKGRYCAGFLQEPPFSFRVGELILRQDFDRYSAPQARIDRAKHFAHCAGSEFGVELVWAQLRSGYYNSLGGLHS
jgi:hypothetical protein